MRRWNGWGDDSTELPLKPAARRFLAGLIGEGRPLPDASLAEVIARVPASRLPEHRLIVGDREVRVTPLRGQEDFHVAFFPDWDSATAALRVLAQQKIPLSMMRLGNPRVASLRRLSTLRRISCPVWAGMTVQYHRNTQH
ncbi:MAG: hypothetical protein IPG20_03950 [Gammaproteobacteria bacterium]|jgi:hypothetical protein|nr:hypothetical protein [Gammaproteobacteria bacterium]